jgi:hypothetical protein
VATRIERIFEALDANKDGKLMADELTEVCVSARNHVWCCFRSVGMRQGLRVVAVDFSEGVAVFLSAQARSGTDGKLSYDSLDPGSGRRVHDLCICATVVHGLWGAGVWVGGFSCGCIRLFKVFGVMLCVATEFCRSAICGTDSSSPLSYSSCIRSSTRFSSDPMAHSEVSALCVWLYGRSPFHHGACRWPKRNKRRKMRLSWLSTRPSCNL